MALNTQINNILRLTGLIQRKATGTPTALAQRMKMSKSALYALLKFLREECHAPIRYDAKRQSYCFTCEGTFIFGFIEKKL